MKNVPIFIANHQFWLGLCAASETVKKFSNKHTFNRNAFRADSELRLDVYKHFAFY